MKRCLKYFVPKFFLVGKLGERLENIVHPTYLLKNQCTKMKFSIKDLVTFTEEILNRKLHFLCSDSTLVLTLVNFFWYFETLPKQCYFVLEISLYQHLYISNTNKFEMSSKLVFYYTIYIIMGKLLKFRIIFTSKSSSYVSIFVSCSVCDNYSSYTKV